ncbi:hypothetical protein GCM10022206_40380 [Streptomyces chiangmaiensis]
MKDDRLNHADYLWAFSAITASPRGQGPLPQARDRHGDCHATARRNLFNRMLGQLYHCLQHRALFNEHTAFPVSAGA